MPILLAYFAVNLVHIMQRLHLFQADVRLADAIACVNVAAAGVHRARYCGIEGSLRTLALLKVFVRFSRM